jgi:hypothetical protein
VPRRLASVRACPATRRVEMRIQLLALGLSLLSSVAFASADVENKWRLEMSGNADSSGQITFAIAPEDEPAITVTVAIADDTDEDAVAAAVVNELRLRLGDLYQVERDDGEEVVIKRRPGERKFSVAVVENTVEGVSIHLDEE